MDRNPVVYIAGPLSAPDMAQVDTNVEKAALAAIKVWGGGIACICPHLNSGAFYGMDVAQETVFLDGYLEIIRRLDPEHDHLIVLPGYEKSNGTMAEIKLAKSLGIRVLLISFDDDSLTSL